MIGRAIGGSAAFLRDGTARALLRVGVPPNVLTLLGTAFMVAAGFCYAAGASARVGWSLEAGAGANSYLLLAGAMLLGSFYCDMLDGAVARLGNKRTRFGAFLDSTLDRLSDFAVYAGIAMHYAFASPANITFILLALTCFLNAFTISYSKARAENLIESCAVGYWQRGERSVGILVATFAHNIPALLVQQAALPMLTALRRIMHTRAVLAGRSPITDPRKGGPWLKIRIWRWPQKTIPYDIVSAVNIAFLMFAPIPATDVIRRWLGG